MLEIIFGISCVSSTVCEMYRVAAYVVYFRCHFLGFIRVRMLSQKVAACVDHRQHGCWLVTELMRPEKLTFPSACSQTHIQEIQRWYSYQHQSATKGFSGWGCLSVNVRVLYCFTSAGDGHTAATCLSRFVCVEQDDRLLVSSWCPLQPTLGFCTITVEAVQPVSALMVPAQVCVCLCEVFVGNTYKNPALWRQISWCHWGKQLIKWLN